MLQFSSVLFLDLINLRNIYFHSLFQDAYTMYNTATKVDGGSSTALTSPDSGSLDQGPIL